jgi:hypothetical protein
VFVAVVAWSLVFCFFTQKGVKRKIGSSENNYAE